MEPRFSRVREIRMNTKDTRMEWKLVPTFACGFSWIVFRRYENASPRVSFDASGIGLNYFRFIKDLEFDFTLVGFVIAVIGL